MYYDINSKKIVQIEESKSLKFLYNNIVGRLILKIISIRFISKICGLYLNSKLSKRKIKKFIKKNNINMDEYEDKNYSSFNDFFIRNIKDNKRKINDGLIAVSDAKLSVYEINKESSFKIKNSVYTIEELIQEKNTNYKYACIFRLCVDDYHHYVFPDNGEFISQKYIKGRLHTVQPIAFKKYKVFTENSRCVSFLECDNLGKVCYIEVGALVVGKIVNEDKKYFKKGEEKGHFEFGGSTVVVLLEDKVKIDQILIDNTNKGIETIVKLGMSIGR